jgi:hypothetical protein
MAGVEGLRGNTGATTTKCCTPQKIKEIVLLVAVVAATSFFALSGLTAIGIGFASLSMIPVGMIVARSCGVKNETIDKISHIVASIGIIGCYCFSGNGCVNCFCACADSWICSWRYLNNLCNRNI